MKKILIANQKGGCGKTSTAVTIAVALAREGFRVGIADADPQKSSLRFLKYRPKTAVDVKGIDWRSLEDIGELPKQALDFLVIDAPGALMGERTKELIGECDMMFIPVLPSFFDIDSTKRFLAHIYDIKRIKKGKVDIHLLANRVRPQLFEHKRPSERLLAIFDDIGQRPIAYISEKSAYANLSEEALTIFDKTQKVYQDIQEEWSPILNLIKGGVDGDGSWY